jgi:hypothetical protein
LSYIPSILTDSSYHLALDVGLLFPRLILTVLLVPREIGFGADFLIFKIKVSHIFELEVMQ